jgi:hypothetical protein
MQDELVKLIADFLVEKKESNGGYAPVETEEVHTLNVIITRLLEAKYERDPDGALPIDWVLVDRTREYHPFLHYSSMRYAHNLKTLGEFIYQLRDAEKNLAMAQNEMSTLVNYMGVLIHQTSELKELTVNKQHD